MKEGEGGECVPITHYTITHSHLLEIVEGDWFFLR